MQKQSSIGPAKELNQKQNNHIEKSGAPTKVGNASGKPTGEKAIGVQKQGQSVSVTNTKSANVEFGSWYNT